MAAASISVVKLGGSLVGDPPRLRRELNALVAEPRALAVVVPGGGAFADAVRRVQAALGFDDCLAHRLALDAMTAMAQVLQAIEPRLVPATDLETVRTILTADHVPIWMPGSIRAGHPSIAECWDVTSDSLALWLATTISAGRCVLVKSCDAPDAATLEDLSRLNLVDRAFPRLATAFSGAVVMRGPAGDRSVSIGPRREVAA